LFIEIFIRRCFTSIYNCYLYSLYVTHEIINFVYIFSDLKSFRWEVLDVDGLQDAPNGLSPAEQVNIFSSFSDIESLKSSRSI
jgi:hypothetical protein